MKKELTEEQKQFLLEGAALKRSIRNNVKSRRFSIFTLIFVWAVVVFDAIRAFMLPGDTLTLKHIVVQNDLQFQTILAFIYTIWCAYSIPKGDEECQSGLNSFSEKWASFIEEESKDEK